MIYTDENGKTWEAHTEDTGFGQRRVVLDHQIDLKEREELRAEVFEALLENEPSDRVRYLRACWKPVREG